MAAPPITERHKHHFHRQSPIKESVRAATTANITIATALNNGDSLDGVTLATGDRVLVKDQTTGSENGIYVVDATPVRDYDVSTDDPAFGFIVYVREGTANAGKVFKNTNTAMPTIDATALTFAELVAAFALTIKDEGSSLATAATSIDFVGAGVVASGTGAAKTVTIPGGASTLDDLTDVVITTPAAGQRLRYSGTTWANRFTRDEPQVDYTGSVILDGAGNPIMVEVLS